MIEESGHAIKIINSRLRKMQAITDLHWANQPCKVTAPVSSDNVVSGNFCNAHGFPGDVLKTSSNSDVLSAPSWSWM